MSNYINPKEENFVSLETLVKEITKDNLHKQPVYVDIPPEKNNSGVKYDQGKEMMSLLPPEALLELGKVMTYGAQKYEKENWRKGISYQRLMDAAQRHLLKFQSNKYLDTDDESKLHHLAHAAVNLIMLLQFELEGRKDLDDRYKKWAI